MASLNRPTRATYVINENVTVDTPDNEDHTFRLVDLVVYGKLIFVFYFLFMYFLKLCSLFLFINTPQTF